MDEFRLRNALYVLAILFMPYACVEKESILLEYPQIETTETVDTYFGHNLKDPYRNLENLKDKEVQNWFKSQGNLSDSVLKSIPNSDFFYEKMVQLENSREQVISLLRVKTDGSYFYLRQPKGSKIEALYYKSSKEAQEELIFNPSKYAKGYIVNYFKVSWDLTKVAIALSKKGEDESEVIIYDLKRKHALPDVIKGLSPALVGGIEWFPDNSGFFYLHIPHFEYDSPDYLLNTFASFHIIGTNNSKAKDIFSKKINKSLKFKKGDLPVLKIKNRDEPFIFGSLVNATDFSDTYYCSLLPNNMLSNDWKLLFSKDEKIIQYEIKEGYITFLTAKEASNFKICRTSFLNPDFKNPEVLVQELPHEVINDFEYLNGKIYFTTLKNGVKANFYTVEQGTNKPIQLPTESGALGLDECGKSLIVTSSGWTSSKSYNLYDVTNMSFKNISLDNHGFEHLKDLTIEELEVEGHDGVKIPLSLIYHKNIKRTGLNQTLIISYGAYGISYNPSITIPFTTWALEGGILAIAHIRGGGEKGNDWYMGGFKKTKPNSWKDLISCTEYLIENKYTSPELMVSFGVSAGGIPVGRAITERPELFAAAIMDSPSINMLRCEFQPSGPANISEFGTVKDSVEFFSLVAMDAYHHLRKGTKYPAVLIRVGMNDGIVPPWDSGKFIAKLQNWTSSKKPALLAIDYNSGHGGDGTMDNLYKGISKLYSFAYWQTNHPKFQSTNN